MSVLVDTSVWSLAFRRQAGAVPKDAVELARLITDGDARIIGPIRQEVLSGLKSRRQFDVLKERLRAFPDVEMDSLDFEEAADLSNKCRARGIQGSSIDFLICAVARRHHFSIFTTDKDFVNFQKVLRLSLHRGRAPGGV